jgi:imidazolonepropionase-like amidohydrolase
MLAIRAAGLFDGISETVAQRPVVLVDAGKIVSVQPFGQPPSQVEVVDLGEAWLVPGLIDAHVHLCFDASADPVGALAARDDDAALAQMRAAAHSALLAGITTVRDLGDRGYLAARLRAEGGDLPAILAAGPPITSVRGHCWFLGGETEGVEGVRAAVRQRAEQGADVIKVMVTGGEMTPGTFPHLPQFGLAEITAAVGEAHALGPPITGHAHGAQGIRLAVEAGMDSVEHCSFLTATGAEPDTEVIALLASSDTVVSVTLGQLPLPGIQVPPRIAALLGKLGTIFAQLGAAGVKMICSSDAGISPLKPHNALSYSVSHFTELGGRTIEAMRGVTSAAAAACHLGHRKGRLAPGFDADILALHGNPLADITALRRVAAVYQMGRPVRG